MEINYRLLNDIQGSHDDRMKNLRKYFPFFAVISSGLKLYKDGRYEMVDMGYITLAVLRFLIEENSFNDRQVTGQDIYEFLTEILRRDFDLWLPEDENKELAGYIFDKLKNDGKPFTMDYFEPVSRKNMTIRVKFIDSRLSDGKVVYSITSDALEFYLDTKEFKEESKINIEQLLLEKMIKSRNFGAGIEVVRRINAEVGRLKMKKQEVLRVLAYNVFEGVKLLEDFNETGIKWFSDEQKAFMKNKELITQALAAAEQMTKNTVSENYLATLKDIHRLENELKKAMSNHEGLLSDCMDLQIRADEIISRYKYSKLKNAFDFKDFVYRIQKNGDASMLEYITAPLFAPRLPRYFPFGNIDDMLSISAEHEEEQEKAAADKFENYKFDDEKEEERIADNYTAMLKTLFDMLCAKEEFDLQEYNEMLEIKYFDVIFRNSDYYSYLVHMCQKKEYDLSEVRKQPDTFLEQIMADILKDTKNSRYYGLKFRLEYRDADMQAELSEEDENMCEENEQIVHKIVTIEGEKKFVTKNIRFIRIQD